MRKYFLLIMIIVLTMLSIVVMGCEEEKAESAEQEELSIEERLVGEWSGKDNTGQIASFIFREDGVAIMVMDNFVIGDEDKGKCLWKINSEHDPIHLDFVLVNHETKEELVIPGIIRFLTDDKIQFCPGRDSERSISFFDAGEENTLILNRQ